MKDYKLFKGYLPLSDAESKLLHAIPKTTLFMVARQLAALIVGRCDDASDADTNAVILKEWEAQFAAGHVPSRPPSEMREGDYNG